MKNIRFIFMFSLLSLLLGDGLLKADVTLPRIMGDNMVLQRDRPLPIWGRAAPAEKIVVRFGNQEKNTVADNSGNWSVTLNALAASATPREMTITGNNSLTLKNIMVGEVWLCSGQSNMEYQLKREKGLRPPPAGVLDVASRELAAGDHPGIRLFKVEKKLSEPDVTSTGWNECSGQAMELFSAVGYFFATNIQKELNVPIGMIESSWGGSRIEPWTPQDAYAPLPPLSAFKDAPTTRPLFMDGVRVGRNFERMVQPLAPFALRGFLWYQGESNCMTNEGPRYTEKMEALIQGWRKTWRGDDLPFLYVQIAPCLYTRRKDPKPHTTETLPEFWEAQTAALRIPHTGMVVTTDLVDNLADIHPSNKWEVGRRLSLIALADVYGKHDLPHEGPTFRSMTVRDGKAILTFDHTEGGLVTKDHKPPTFFTIAGADHQFELAEARIEQDQIIVSNPKVNSPAAVRFAWTEIAQPNLYNGAGLPVVPFRTDGKPN